jgi:protease-4
MHPVSFGREVASMLLRVFAILLTIVIIVGVLSVFSYSFTSISDGDCTIAVMPISGIIMPFGYGYEYAEFTVTPNDVRDFLSLVKDDELFIKGILFEVNSPGGAAAASENIANQISELELPTVALIGDMGASGGYMVASAADHILASAMSDIGSIGVTMSYVEESEKNKEDGLTYVPLISGKYKDAGDPNKPLSDEERTYFQAQIDTIYETFVTLVAKNRNLPYDEVKQLADGSTLIGKQAVEKKLVDAIGDRNTVKTYFAEKLGKDVSEISFCEYTKPLGLI